MAQAATAVDAFEVMSDETIRRMTDYRARAVKLLRDALAATPADKRAEFWRANVAADPTLTGALRNYQGFVDLARTYAAK